MEYRKKKRTRRSVVAVNYTLHFIGPSDGQQLTCFASAVAYNVVAKICFAQVGHVDERHAAHVKAHHEHIPGKGKHRLAAKFEFSDRKSVV